MNIETQLVEKINCIVKNVTAIKMNKDDLLVKTGDYICIANNFLYCDDPNNKKGFTFKGKIFSPNWINVYKMKNYGGVDCFIVRVHYHLGCDYEGADKIVPVSEFEKQGFRHTKYDKNIDWYIFKKE